MALTHEQINITNFVIISICFNGLSLCRLFLQEQNLKTKELQRCCVVANMEEKVIKEQLLGFLVLCTIRRPLFIQNIQDTSNTATGFFFRFSLKAVAFIEQPQTNKTKISEKEEAKQQKKKKKGIGVND